MNDTVEIAVQYSENEFVRGMTFTNARNKNSLPRIAILVIFGFLGYLAVYVVLIRPNSSWQAQDFMPLLFGALLVLPIALILKNVNLREEMAFSKLYESNPLFREQYKIVISDLGIRSTANSYDSDLRWSGILEATETPDDLFFFTGKHQSLFIPKRVFSENQLRDLRRLAQGILSSKATFLH